MGEADGGVARLCLARGRHTEGVAALSRVGVASAPGERNGFLSALLSLPGVVAFWVVYGALHAGLRLSVSSTLTIDDARANELTQTLALGYQVRQPPLYEWLLWCSQQFLGTGLPSHLLVRYTLIALLGIATFGAVRAAVEDDRWAAAASLSLAFSYPVGWTFHEWGTQTILLCVACMVTIHAAISFLERPGLGASAFLGFAVALGTYAKFSYPLLLGGLLLATLSLREARGRFADWRLLLSLAIVVLALAPYTYWLLQVHGDVAGNLSAHLVKGDESHLARSLKGLGRLILAVPTFLLPWLLFVAVLAPKAFMPAAADTPPGSTAERLVLRTLVFAVLLAAIGAVAIGATNVSARYMHAILIVAPVYAFARVARLAPGEDRVQAFAVFAIAVAVVVFGIRVVSFIENPLTRQLVRGPLLPYAALADALKTRGVTDGTVVTPDVREGGNLRAFLPDLRVMSADSLRVERPPRRETDARSCVLIWAEHQNGWVEENASDHQRTAERIRIAEKPSGILASGAGTWLLARLDPQSLLCR